MRNHFTAALIALFTFSANAAEFRLSPNDIEAENAYLSSLGVDLRGRPFLLTEPFAKPVVSPRAFLLPHDWYTKKSPTTVRADEFLADLESLETVLRYQYSGWEVAEKRGWNWQTWFHGWRQSLAARGTDTLTIDEAFAPVRDLHAFMPDNHTGPLIQRRDFQSRSVSALLETAPLATCTHVQNKDGKLFALNQKDASQLPQPVLYPSGVDGQFVLRQMLIYPSARGELIAIHCGTQSIRLIPDYDPSSKERMKAVLALAELTKDEPKYRRVSTNVGYLRMPLMTAKHEVEYRKLESEIAQLSDGKEKVLIVDARNNGGGQLFLKTLMRWFEPKTMLQTAQRIIWRQTAKHSCFENTISWGYQAGSGVLDHPELAKEFATFSQELLDQADKPCGIEFEQREVPAGQRLSLHNRRFDAKAPRQTPLVLLLIDGGCGSNCEALTGVLGAYPQTLVAGVSTFGVGEFGGVGDILFPRTRASFRISTNFNEIYEDNRSFEGYGIKPDLLLNTEALNSPAFIVRLAEALSAL